MPEGEPSPGGRLQYGVDHSTEPVTPGDLQLHESLAAAVEPKNRLIHGPDGSSPAPEAAPKIASNTMGMEGNPAAAAEAGVEVDSVLAEVLAAPTYVVSESEGGGFIAKGAGQRADVTDLLGVGMTIGRYHPENPHDTKSTLKLEEVVTITDRRRSETGSQAGSLRIGYERPSKPGNTRYFDLDDLGRRDPEGRSWRLPQPS